MNQTSKYLPSINAILGLAFLSVIFTTLSAYPAETDKLSSLIDEGEATLSFRYRYESVDHDSFAENAQASTLRSRLSLKSGNYKLLNFFLELDDIHTIAKNDYNEGAGNTPGRLQYPVVADPEGAEFNQLYAELNIAPGSSGKLRTRFGRQRINLDNQRFIGGVGWRQNEQTYDAASLQYTHGKFTGFYAYVDQVNRIFGPDVPAGKHDQNGTHLVNVSGNLSQTAKLAAYYYGIDNSDSPSFSTNTWGVRVTGEGKANSGTKLSYALEYAVQHDAGNNPGKFSANYWNLQATAAKAQIKISLGWEVLEGDANSPANEAFRTPLATLHAFNGWADVFLATPKAGLDDKYVKLQYGKEQWVLHARYHHFEEQDGNARLGDEIDLRMGYKFSENLRGDLYFADFYGKNGLSDVRKFWLALSLTL